MLAQEKNGGVLSSLYTIFFGQNKSRVLTQVFFYSIFILPVVFVAGFGLYQTWSALTEEQMKHQQEELNQVSHIVGEHVLGIRELVASASRRPLMREHVQNERWNEAMKILEDLPRENTTIARVFLSDIEGTETADFPQLRGAVGQNFSYRDWYRGVTASWEVYISEIYIRAAFPEINLVSIAAPIFSLEQDRVTGILVAQLEVEHFETWIEEVNPHPSVVQDMYLIDHYGQLVAHTGLPTVGRIQDYSFFEHIQAILRGESGIETITKNGGDEYIQTYAPVSEVGWGIVSESRTDEFYALRNQLFTILLSAYLAVLVLVIIVASVTIRLFGRTRRFEHEMRSYLSQIGDGVLVIDREWKVLLLNKEGEKMTGCKGADIIGKPFRNCFRFVQKDSTHEDVAFIEETMLYGRTAKMPDGLMLLRQDGKKIPVADSAAPLLDEAGHVTGAIIVFRDISTEIDYLNIRREFIYLASHELRSPLTAIRGYLDILSGQKSISKDERQYLDRMDEAAQRMAQSLTTMLSVAQIESGELAMHLESINVGDLCDAAAKDLQSKIKEKELKYTQKIKNEPIVLNADRELLFTILKNIVSNAVKYTPDGGSVQVHVAREADQVVFKVTDTGYGIPKDAKDKIFKRFFRGDNILQTKETGTGLGLYIVKQIIDKTGGTISFVSDEGKGTTFTFAYPLSGMKDTSGKA